MPHGTYTVRVLALGVPYVPSTVYRVPWHHWLRLQRSTEYASPTFGPMYKGRPILTEVRLLTEEFTAAPGDAQDRCL